VTALLATLVAGLALHDRAGPAPSPWLSELGLEARHVTVRGHRIRYVRAGDGSPAAVLVHGFGSSLYTWKDVIPGLARDHQVVALDLPGFGLSDQPPDLTIEELPAAVVGLMDALAIERAVLVGNSLGGSVCALLAARDPGRVSGLVLVDSAGYNFDPADRPLVFRLTAGPLGPLVGRLPGKRLLVEAALRQVFHDPRLVTPERVAEYLQGARRPGSFRSVRSLAESLRDRSSLVSDALTRVRAPTLVVWGREDGWIPLAHADRFTAALAGARKVVIDDCGHVPQEEKPEAVLAALREFLARLSAGRG
jgi:pimeloyl-ACP methyl ester carboxylesterase